MVAHDADGSSRPVASWDQVVDQLSVMLRQEEEYNSSFHNQDELFCRASSDREDCISWNDATMIRRKMCEWAYHVVDYFEYNRDVVGVALNFVDRYTVELVKDGNRPLSRKNYQSIFVVSLYVALKLQGSSRADATLSTNCKKRKLPAVINVEIFAELSRGMLTVKSLETEERNLVSRLKYRLNPPTSGNFNEYLILFLIQENALRVNPFLDVGSIQEDALHHIFEVAKYHTELSTFDVRLTANCRPSCVAAASILNALEYLRERLGDTTVPPDVSDAFESNVVQLIPEVTAGDIDNARDHLRELCPPETLDTWPGGWNDSNNQSMEEPSKDQIMEDTGEVPSSPTGVNSDMI